MSPWQVKIAAVLVGVLATILLYRKITSIARLMVALWIGMLVTVGWLIVSGLWHFNAGIAFDFPPQAFTFNRGFFLGLSSSTLYVMYCYLGYYGVCYLGDEVKAAGAHDSSRHHHFNPGRAGHQFSRQPKHHWRRPLA